MFGVGHIHSFKICYLARRDRFWHMQMKFVIELIIPHSVLKIFCPAVPLDVRYFRNIWTNFRSEFPHTRTSKKVHINICPQRISFRGTIQQNFDLSPVDFYPWDTSKPLFVFSSNWKWRHVINAFFMHVETFTTSPGPLKGHICRDQKCPCVHLFRRRTLENLLWVVTR